LALDVDIVVMENARELIRGNFRHHYELFRQCLEAGGFNVFGRTYFLTRFGLPQVRERAIVVAARARLPLHTLESLWDGWTVEPKALTVRRAFSAIAPHSTGWRVAPQFSSDDVKLRFAAIPRNGGSWLSLANGNGTSRLLTNGMRRILTKGILGSHPDIYGRMAWDKPAPTIKRECAHIGNGRYGHPEQDRLCTVREMAILQGFPNDFEFRDTAVSNMYRHIGDAVPPLISHQLAHLCNWMLTGHQPAIRDTILPNTHLSPDDLHLAPQTDLAYA
jgi:DNA (cytosine-5)-methyltransferase 1